MDKLSENLPAYHVALLGAGIAGLSLLYKAMKKGLWKDQKILVVDRSFENGKNKMLSFWSDKDKLELPYVAHIWSKMAVVSQNGDIVNLKTDGYRYITVDAKKLIDTYLNFLSEFENISFLEADVLGTQSLFGFCDIRTSKGRFISDLCFNSIFIKPTIGKRYQYFLQHFKGITIRTTTATWDAQKAIIMDFRTSQDLGTAFFYCLPLSKTDLFIEYTMFSKFLLAEVEYLERIDIYIRENMKISNYEVVGEENGVIPMTDFPFKRKDGNIINLGTAGGDTRGSTGYTLKNVLKTIDQILDISFVQAIPHIHIKNRRRDRFYDALLLRVLDRSRYPGDKLFFDLFRNVDASRIFRFLDGESNLVDDLHIILSLRPRPFICALATYIKGLL